MLQRQLGAVVHGKVLSASCHPPFTHFSVPPRRPRRRWLKVSNTPKSARRNYTNEAIDHNNANTERERERDTPPPAPRISTFVPSKLRATDYLDLSNASAPYCYLAHSPDPKLNGRSGIRYKSSIVGPAPFPPNTRGFLYFHRTPRSHAASGQLRFRLVDTPDPAAFSAGTDLPAPEGGTPWGPHLLVLRKARKYAPIYHSLIRDGAVTSERDREIAKFAADPNASSRRRYLDAITDPFVVNLSCVAFSMNLLEPQGITVLMIQRPFVTYRLASKREAAWDHSPYSGTALVRFELIRQKQKRASSSSSSSSKTGKGSTTATVSLGMRLLKFIHPPNPGDALVQKEGELLKKWNPEAQQEVLWKRNLELLSEDAVKKLMRKYCR